jgi:hypothetical protein
VNGNQYDSKCDVYLDGGPGPKASAKAAGLPAGDYYFQVTDPSGDALLSTDPVSNRRFTVSANGVIVAYSGFGGPPHPTGFDRDQMALGAITVGLATTNCPADFRDTPNNGGVYKVWVTPVPDYAGDPANVDNPCRNGCFHGFVASRSKTDNFKIRTRAAGPTANTSCLTAGIRLVRADGSEVAGGNWEIRVTDSLGSSNSYYTDPVTGAASVCGLAPGAYTVLEVMQYGWQIFGLTVNGTAIIPETVYSFTWTSGQPNPVIVFTNIEYGGN